VEFKYPVGSQVCARNSVRSAILGRRNPNGGPWPTALTIVAHATWATKDSVEYTYAVSGVASDGGRSVEHRFSEVELMPFDEALALLSKDILDHRSE
jgi:hypothetical protein